MAIKSIPNINQEDGQVFYGDDVDTLITSTVMRFPDASARSAYLSGDKLPTTGMMSFIPALGFQVYMNYSWCPLPGTFLARLRNTTPGPLAGSGAYLPFNIEENDYDPYNIHSTVSNTPAIVAPVYGWYRVTGTIRHSTITAGTLISAVMRVRSLTVNQAFYAQANSGNPTSIPINDVIRLNAGDDLSFYVSNALSTNMDLSSSVISVAFVSYG